MPAPRDRDRRKSADLPQALHSIDGRVPPHDLDTEAAVLSACLLGGEPVIAEVVDIIPRGEVFYSDPNGRIFDAVLATRAAGVKVDIATVADRLREQERLAAVGGPSYLAQLADSTPAIAHVADHARIVFDKWRRRAGLAECQFTTADGYARVEDTQAWFDAHIGRMNDLATLNTGDPVQPIGDGLLDRLTADWNTVQTGAGLMGVRSGYDALDRKLAGLRPGHLYIVAARPGMGKTALACGIAVNVAAPPEQTESLFRPAIEYGVPVFSLEMPREDLQLRFTCTEAGVDLGAYLRGDLDGPAWDAVFRAAAFLAGLPVWIDASARITVPAIKSKVRQLAARWCRRGRPAGDGRAAISERKIGAVVVDYLQLVGAHTPGRSREEEVAEVSRDLKEMSKSLGVPVIALAQLNRSVETRAGKDKRPQLSDLRESGGIEQDADAIVFIYRDEYYNPGTTNARGIAELIVAKQRNGATGKVLLRFDARCTRFSNLDASEAASYVADPEDE